VADRGPYRVGLTGGIASGKSLVGELFVGFGAPLIDADVAARSVVEPESEGLAEVVAAFGAEALTPAGGLNRAWLRQRIFGDPAERIRLEAILHPRIRSWMEEKAAAAQAPYVMLVIPLLVEKGLQKSVDRVLVVDVPESVQIERLRRRDGISLEQAGSILAAQCDRKTRLAAAHDVIDNSGDSRRLWPLVESLHFNYLKLASNSGK